MATQLRDILSRRKAHGRTERKSERNDEAKQASSARQHQHQPQQAKTSSGEEKDTNLNFNGFPGRIEQDPSRKHRIVQHLPHRYIIRRRLVKLLEERFPGQWELRHVMDTWMLNIPAPLTDDEVEACEADHGSGSGSG
ncbi:hypothetical protein BJX99DRAFT_86596 [Aspergillus californicus]